MMRPIMFPPDDQDVLSSQTQFPPSGQAELTYENNVHGYKLNQFASYEDITACLGTELLFEDSLCRRSVSWDSMLQGFLGEGEAINYLVTGDDQIIVTSESFDGTMVRDTFTIDTSAPLLEILENTYIINKGESVQLQVASDPTDSISWKPESSLNNAFISFPIASPPVTTDYLVTVTDSLGCSTAGQVKVIVIAPGHVPNLFTPNGDGRNDRILIYGLEGVASFFFKIVNHTGNMVYQSNSLQEVKTIGWDGTWNNAPLPSGVFYWSLFGRHEDGTLLSLNNKQTGIIHLVR